MNIVCGYKIIYLQKNIVECMQIYMYECRIWMYVSILAETREKGGKMTK